MDKSSRSYKMVINCRSLEDLPRLEPQKRKNRWFCNRPLSPVLNNAEEQNLNILVKEQTTLIHNLKNTEKRNPECTGSRSEISSVSDPFADSGDSSYVPSSTEVSSSAPENSPPDFNVYTPISFHDNNSLIEEQPSLVISSDHIHNSTDALKDVLNNVDNAGTKKTSNENINENAESVTSINANFCGGGIEDDQKCVSSSNLRSTKNKSEKSSKLKNFCYYCETDVLNFARHVINNHSTELDVIKLCSMPAKSLERRRLFAHLRNKGNFLNTANHSPRRVRRAQIPDRSILPCDNCLGFFSSKLLYRHRNKCVGKSSDNAQSAGQSVLIHNIRTDKRLKCEVFPRMRADKISLEAKADQLICAFGARYLRSHREKHFATLTSRKMRELSKILIELKKLEPSIKSLFQALQPKHFDLFIQATQTVAKYNQETEVFGAPSLAMNIVNSFKQCCDIAINLVLRDNQQYGTVPAAEAEAQLKTMIHLFTSNWRFEISSQAANNLHLNKWNKVTIVPLASDLKTLRNYLLHSAKKAVERLQANNKDVHSYNILVDTIYCRVILLNRKRPGELQRMLLQTYLNCGNDKAQYEEFERIVTPSERILLTKLKRVVIRGKRGRGVPVLFSKDVQDNIDFMLKCRSNFVPKENLYLFARSNSTTEISGYKILSKYAQSCGAKNPTSITSTRLRKHLATLTQIFNMTDSDIDQLANFMGHTAGVHRGSYRLPDDIYQTAKLSKLLLLMERGGAENYKGKVLEDIDLDMEEDLLKEDTLSKTKDNESEIDDEIVSLNTENTEPVVTASINEISFKKSVSMKLRPEETKKKRVLIPWTNEQKQLAKKFFREHIKKSNPPKRHECEELIGNHPQVFHNKSWLKIKVFIQNAYSKKKRQDEDH